MGVLPFMLLTLASTAVLITTLMVVYYSKISAGARVHERSQRLFTTARFYRSAAVNMLVSLSMLFTGVIGFGEHLIRPDGSPWWVAALQALAVLGLYDLFYYFVHRFLFHGWSPLRKVHSVHHSCKYPTAADSLYIHPIETAIGVGLLFVSLFILGPIDEAAFRVVFVLYTHMNIINHCALDFHVFPLNILGFLARKHDRHHDGMKVGNYATLTPLPDVLFGTFE